MPNVALLISAVSIGDIRQALLAVGGGHFQTVTFCNGLIALIEQALLHDPPIERRDEESAHEWGPARLWARRQIPLTELDFFDLSYIIHRVYAMISI
jgi:hypothetical protein